MLLRTLIADDERNIRTTLALCLEKMGCKVSAVATAEAALAAMQHEPIDLVFLDLRLGEASGLKLLPQLLALRIDPSWWEAGPAGSMETRSSGALLIEG